MTEQEILPIEYSTLSQSVLRTIRDMIINGQIAPGERINEVHLARSLGVSRGPVREALSKLQVEGVLTYKANRGMTVTTLSAQDAYEVYTLRGLLEQEAVLEALPHLTEQEKKHLGEIIERFKSASMSKNRAEIVECDTEFHHTIVAASGHSRLIEVHRQLDTLVEVMFTTVASHIPARLGRVVEIHQTLFEALLDSDPTTASQAFRTHYLEALQELWDHLER